MSDAEPTADPAAEPARRRRSGGRGDRAQGTTHGPEQRPFAQPRMRYRPTEVISSDELESIHQASMQVLEEIGMDFLDADARALLRTAGADVDPDSQRVRFDRGMVLELVAMAPSSFTLHTTNPAHDLQIGGDMMAFGSVASAPNVNGLGAGRREIGRAHV